MKLLLVIGALLGLANAFPQRSLVDDVDEILALVPIDDIKAVNAKYADDPEMQQVLAYIRGDDFQAIVSAVTSSPEYSTAVAYLEEAGLDVDRILNWLAEFLSFSTRSISEVDSDEALVKSFHGWFNEVRALIPTAEIRALIAEKLQTSSAFQGLYESMSGETFRALVNALSATSEWQDLLNKGREHGAPVDAWIAVISGIFGW